MLRVVKSFSTVDLMSTWNGDYPLVASMIAAPPNLITDIKTFSKLIVSLFYINIWPLVIQ